MKVAVTGASGLIGRALTASLRDNGDQVVALVRRTPTSAAEIAWDPLTPLGSLAPGALDGTDAVVHLAGAGIADHRWTDSYKEEIRSSRVQGTRALTEFLAAMDQPPAVLLSGSAVGWYGDTGSREVDESAPAGAGFLAGVVRDWETAADPARQAGIRVATLRTGIVLSRHGGVLARLLLPFRLGLGARLGTGTQYMSWVTLADWIRAARYPPGRPGRVRAGEPDLTEPGDQRRVHRGPGGCAAPPGAAEHPVPGAVSSPRRGDQRPDDQRPGPAPRPAPGRVPVHPG